MKIIITGASGGFGRLSAEGLFQRMPAEQLILVTRSPEKLDDLAKRGADVRFGDFTDRDSLLKAFSGGDRMLMISTNLVGTRLPHHINAVTAASECNVQHVAYTSFVGAEPKNPSLALHDHRGTEEALRESGMAWTALRNSHYADFILAAGPIALKTGKWVSSAGDGTVAQVTRQDCINCAVEVMATEGHENTIYNITGPTLNTMRDVAQIVSEVGGKPIEFVDVDDEGMFAHFDSLGIPRQATDDNVVEGVPWSSNGMVTFERTIREGRFSIISDDVEKLTGQKPMSLRTFAEEHAEFLRSA